MMYTDCDREMVQLEEAPIADESGASGIRSRCTNGQPAKTKPSQQVGREEVLKVQGSDKGEKRHYDDITGQLLDSKLVDAARKKEIDYFKSKGVWEIRDVSEAKALGKNPISVRWVDVNKGDDSTPNMRSRLVARQIRGPGQDSVFAPPPPLAALGTVLSLAVSQIDGEKQKSWEAESEQRMQLSFIDISRAYFNAKTDPDDPTYVQLPSELGLPPNKCGLLRRHMYGTQKAADGWQSEYSGTLIRMGFRQGTASACVFYHEDRQLICSVHGDDFTTG